MKDTLYRLESLVPFDVRGIESHLSRMAAKGWRLEYAGALLWRYRRAEPAQVHYAVACAPAEREDGDLRDRQFFEDLCASAGWERVTDLSHAQSYAKDADDLQVFCSEAEAPVPLETDEPLRLKRIHQAMKRTYLRWSVWILLWTALWLGSQIYEMWKMPRVFFLNGDRALLVPLFFFSLLLLALFRIASYFRWYARSRRSVEDGGGLAPVSSACRAAERLTLGILAAPLAISFLLKFSKQAASAGTALGWGLLGIAILALGVLAFLKLSESMERRGLDKGTQVAVLLLCGALLLVLFGRRPQDPAESIQEWQQGQEQENVIYRWRGEPWDADPAPIPLTMEDLTGTPWVHVRRDSGERGSVLATVSSYGETVCQEDGEEHDLRYSLIRVDAKWLYEHFRIDCLHLSEPLEYRAEDPAPWGAGSAYRLYREGVPEGDWMVFWPGCILDLDTDLDLTPEQKTIIRARLAPEAGEEED